MKRLLAVGMTVLLLLGIMGGAMAEEFVGQIYVGISCAMTGDVPLEGERVRQAVSLAFEEANEKGGINGYEVVGIFEDDANTANTAVNVINKFGGDEKIVASIGPHRSASLLAVEQICERYGLPTLSGGTSTSFYELDNPYIFRIRPSDSLVPVVATRFCIEELGFTKIGLIYNNDDYGNGAKEVIEEYVSGLENVELVALQGHNTGDKDMYAQLLACKDAGAEVIIGWTHVAEAAIIARQYKELGLEESIQFLGCSSWCNTAFYDLVDESIPDGTYATVDYTTVNPNPFPAEFTAKFIERYGVEPENMAGCYYDAALILLDSLQRAADAGEVTRESVRDALATQPEIDGNQGTLYADGIDMVHATCIIRNAGSTPEFIAIASE